VRATGGEPCRDVLRAAHAGEELLLASYCPFEISGPYKEYGPVFILANPDTTPVSSSIFPVSAEYGYFGQQFVLRAYSKRNELWMLVFLAHNNLKQIYSDFFKS